MSADLFLQKLKINGEDVGTHSVLSITYIERLNLTCPKLMLKMVDRNKIFQDNASLHDGAKLELVLGDASGRGEELFKETFIVGANWEEGKDTVMIEALQEDIHRIKQPESIPRFFVEKTVRQILASIFPNHEIVMDFYELKHSYHVLTGATVSMMLERLKWDAGAEIYLLRGKVYFTRLKSFSDHKEAFQFDYGRNASDNPTIISYKRNNPQQAIIRQDLRDYFCWDRTKGMSALKGGLPREFLASAHESHLKNHNISVVPVMECTMAGDGRFMPSMMIKLELNRSIPDSVLDESVPAKQLMIGARHFQEGMKYISVCEFGEVIDAN
jgi:hypothetical protein